MNAQADSNAADADTGGIATRIGGLSVLKGLVLYGAVLTFAGFYTYFIVKIAGAKPHAPPKFDGTMVSASAALGGVLGSAFALVIGVPTDENSTNIGLKQALGATGKSKVPAQIRKALSLEPSDANSASWPLTFGIWVYALVASGVAVTYFLNQDETPPTIKTLAVAFAGYVIALVTAAYGITTSGK